MAVVKQSAIHMMEKNRPSKQWPQWLAVASVSLSSFSTGFSFLWSSPTLVILQSEHTPFPITNDQGSWIASTISIGCAAGSIIGSLLSRKLGPKNTSLISTIPLIIGFALILFADNPKWLYASRLFQGLFVGFSQTATPIYVVEIAENQNRGALMSFFVLCMGAGGLLMTSVGPYVSIYTMAGIALIPPILMLLSLIWMPDSPFYLVRIGQEDKAASALKWFRRQKNDMIIEEEMNVIRKNVNLDAGWLECLKSIKIKANRKATVIVIIEFVAQQMCGAVAVMFYQEQIYKNSNVPISADVAVIATSALGIITGFTSIFVIDRWGRKPLAILSMVGCSASTSLLGLYLHMNENKMFESAPYLRWTPIVLINILQISFSFGMNQIPSTQLGEMFSSEVKEIAFCAMSVICAIQGFVLVKCFQIVADAYGLPVVFWGLSSATVLMLFIMVLVMPETKGKSFLDIQKMLTKREKNCTEIKMVEIAKF